MSKQRNREAGDISRSRKGKGGQSKPGNGGRQISEKVKKKSGSDKGRNKSERHSLPDGRGSAAFSDSSFYRWGILPVILFTAVTILIVFSAIYTRQMGGFYWTSQSDTLVDFFSYRKMQMILFSAAAAAVALVAGLASAKMKIRKNIIYIPMAVYSVFVLLSYIFCEYKEFSLLGYNDRFEGTLVLLAYMLMLFYIINIVCSERSAKLVIGSTGISCVLLALLGVAQSLGKDPIQTEFGKRLITSSRVYERLESVSFLFDSGEIYQTVYNINYVAFYLALVIPVFSVLFIGAVVRFRKDSRKSLTSCIGLLLTVALLLYNMMGARSAGGLAGLAAAALAGVLLFNRRLLKWWKPLLALICTAAVILAITAGSWTGQLNELSGDIGAMTQSQETQSESAQAEGASLNTADRIRPYIDYIVTEGDTVRFSAEGEEFVAEAALAADGSGSISKLEFTDGSGNKLELKENEDKNGEFFYSVEDSQFRDLIRVKLGSDAEGNFCILICTADKDWQFVVTEQGILYRNGYGKLVSLQKAPAIGFENMLHIGNGRGYIWSRALAMSSDNLLIGDGADTFCLYYPHYDYAGKYNLTDTTNPDNVIDKPHSMYLGMLQGTGGISLAAFIAMMAIYMIQSVRTYYRREYTSWMEYAGAGIFIGVCGFLTAGLVNDSTVSVMPMFYGLLGTGIAVNMMLGRAQQAAEGGDGRKAAE